MSRSSSPSELDQSFLRFQETGDPAALALVFDATAGELMRVASYLMEDLHAAEDLVQGTYLVAIERRSGFQHKAGVLSWLMGIMTNLARRQRRRSAHARSIDLDVLEPQPDLGVGPVVAAETEELSQAVSDALATLPKAYRPVLNLYLRKGMTAREIAVNLERPVPTVHSQLRRGLDLLRRALPNSLIAGVVVLTVPVSGLAAIREVVLTKAAAATAAAKSTTVVSSLSSLFGTGKSGGLVVGTGTLLAAALGVTVIVSVDNGDRDLPRTVTPVFMPSTSPSPDFAKSASHGSNRDVAAITGNLRHQPTPTSLPSPMAFPSPQTDPRRITPMPYRSITSNSFTSPVPPAVPVPMHIISTLVLSTTLLYPTLLSSQSPLFSFKGQTQSELLGVSLSPALDANFDLYGDLLIGATGWDDPNLGNNFGRAYLYSGQTGDLLHAFTGEKPSDTFGSSVSSASDINLDGYADVLVSANGWDLVSGTPSSHGRLYLYSGKDGSLLQTQEGEATFNIFGFSVSSASDVNQDGYPDYLAGAPNWNDPNITGGGEGRMYLYSGKDHTQLSTFQPEKSSTTLGRFVSSASDVNQDGYPDFVAGAPGWDDPNSGTNHGRIYVYSGKDLTLFFTYQGEQAGTQLGNSVSPVSDLNLDGNPDILAGAHTWDPTASFSAQGRVYAISGQGPLLFTLNGENSGDEFGNSVSAGQDLNQDGYSDLLTGAPYWDAPSTKDNRGRLYLYSGKDQSIIFIQDGENSGDNLGYSSTQLPDLNQDGNPDLAAGAALWDNPQNPTPGPTTDEGKVYMYSGTPLPLTSDEHLLSISVASTQNLTLQAGPTHAGRQYWVFGNFLLSGTSPGVSLGSVNIPLNPDPWTQVTIDFANTAALSMTKGTLDGSGNALASLNSLAPQPAAPLGLTLQHCFLVYQAGPPDAYYMASNLVPWTTVP